MTFGRSVRGRLGRFAGIVAAMALVGARPVAGRQETVRSVRMSVAVAGTEAQVILEVTLDGADVATLPATWLGFGSTTPVDLALGSDGAPGSWASGPGVARTTSVTVEPGPTAGTALVLATYRVQDAVEVHGASLRAHVPVLSVDRRPTAPGPGFFRAELRLPPEWSVTEGFPSGIRRGNRPGLYEVDLSVVPSVVSFHGRSDGAWRPGVPLLLDLIAGAILLAFSLFGWRHLKEVTA